MPIRTTRLPFARSVAASALATALAGFVSPPAGAAGTQPTTYRGSRLVASPTTGWCSEMRGPASGIGLEGEKLLLQSKKGTAEGVEFQFASGKKQEPLLVPPDPTTGFSVLVHGSGGAAHRSAFAGLDPTLWKPIGKGSTPKGWTYKDKDGAHGGIRSVRIEKGQLKIKAKGDGFGFVPDGSDGELWVDLQVGNTRYCARFGDAAVERNENGLFKARGAEGPSACPDPVCGNKVEEVGESCDDGNLVPGDGCANDCLDSACVASEPFASTFEAIQTVVFDGYGCTSDLCHGNPDHPSGLHLVPGTEPDALQKNHDALLTSTPANQLGYDHFIVPGDSKTSLVYQALWRKLNCGVANEPPECAVLDGEGVLAMPVGGQLTADQLAAIDLWIHGGAPKDLVVAGTADKLGACLPPADPLKVDPLPAPGAGNGVQLVSSAWSLPKHSENEVCFPIYFDFTQTTLIPQDQQFDCPGVFGALNPSNKCFRWHEQLLLQDPQSHHSIIHIYTGQYGVDHPAWGPWTYKMNALDDPLNGQTCDPLAVDSTTGQNVGCSGNPIRNAACLAYGPPDFSTGGQNGAGTAPQISGSQQPRYPQKLADGVYSILPMQGIVVFNSHAFNLTDGDTTMNQYLNLWLAGATDQKYQSQQIFDADDIFIQDVPPYETREYCATYTIPESAKLFWLSSHTHRHGVRWRTWGPPNAACTPGSPCGDQPPCDPGSDGCTCTPAPGTCAPPGPAGDDRLMYYSTRYNDPLQLKIDPPLLFTGTANDRRFLFCALFDNGSTPTSPSVKRQSTSPSTPFIFGGPCEDSVKSCISPDPAKHGQLCASQPDPDRFCDSGPGAFDGFCDACPVEGGFTTEDEMFIKLGNFFVETPAP